MLERSYRELILMPDYDSRLEYLKLLDNNASSPRVVSLDFFQSRLWREIRKLVIQRDVGFDLGVFGIYICGPIYVHHINPIDKDDILNMTAKLTNLDNLICTSLDTHNAIHYKPAKDVYIERRPGDTIDW